jgi:hypothetical protein
VYRQIIGTHLFGFHSRWILGLSDSNQLSFYIGGTSTNFAGPTTVPLNQWSHVAASRAAGTLRVFINGVAAVYPDVTTDTEIGSSPGNFNIGTDQGSGNANFYGYIDDVRIIKGQGLYTYNFVPAASQLTTTLGTPTPIPASPVILLMNMNGSNGSTAFTDSSDYARTVTAEGSAQLTTSVKKYGTASAYFDGNGGYLSVPSNSELDLGTGDFTIECWVYLEQNVVGYPNIVSRGFPPSFSTQQWVLALSPGNIPQFNVSNGSTWLGSSSSTTSLDLNQWYHIALVRSAGTMYWYINGSLTSSQSYTANIESNASSQDLRIGNPSDFVGYIDDLRIIKGQALYTYDFVTPASQLTTTPGTPTPIPTPAPEIDIAGNAETMILVSASPINNTFGIVSTSINAAIYKENFANGINEISINANTFATNQIDGSTAVNLVATTDIANQINGAIITLFSISTT